MPRICFVLKVLPHRLDEYRERHREVWPEMKAALTAAGWRDYSLYLRPDGLLVGHVTCDHFEASRAAMKDFEVNERWQIQMMPFFDTSGTKPDDAMQPLEEIFHLD